MKILVTGSEGNIGRKLVPYLEQKGYTVWRFDQKQNFAKNYTVGDINSPVELERTFEKFRPDVVYHMAAMVSRITCEASPAITILTNVAGTNNVIQLCKQYEAKIIYFSTSEVYGNIGGVLSEFCTPEPNNIYGLSKLLGEHIIKYEDHNGLDWVIVRPFMFYDEDEDMGEYRSAMIRFAEGLIRKEKITVHKNAFRSWMHMSDAVMALEKTMFVSKHIINIGHPTVHSVAEIAQIMCDELELSYNDYVIETSLPEKMTLNKTPDLTKQSVLLKTDPLITLRMGIKKVLNVVRNKILTDKSLGGGNISASGNWVSSDCLNGSGGKCNCA